MATPDFDYGGATAAGFTRNVKRGQSSGAGAPATVTPIPPSGNLPPTSYPIPGAPTGTPTPSDPTGGYMTIADRLAQLLGGGEGTITATPTQTLAPSGGIGIGTVLLIVAVAGGGLWYVLRKGGK
jgi:lysozyme family protein